MTKKQIQTAALKYLSGNRLMTLATSAKNKPWAATVFFAYDTKFNIYFFSRPDTRHCKDIDINPSVAIAVNHDWGGGKGIKGFVMQGKAVKSTKMDDYELYKKRNPWVGKYTDHIIYKIKPSAGYYINEKLFGHFFRVKVI